MPSGFHNSFFVMGEGDLFLRRARQLQSGTILYMGLHVVTHGVTSFSLGNYKLHH